MIAGIRAIQPRPLATFAFSAGGYLILAGILWWGVSVGKFTLTPGDALVWDRVGDEVRAGISPYYAVTGSGGFYYAPPWAILWAVVSWLPVQVVAAVIMAVEAASLRYIAGSWLRVGYLCWLPLVAFELPSAQINLIMAAALAAAVRGDPRAAMLVAAAKLSPLLAIRENWRRAVPVAVLLVAVTLPVAGLWVDWIRQLTGTYGHNIAGGAQLDVPFLPRLLVALVLVATGRRWARVVGAVIATPALYWVSGVILLGLLPRRSVAQERDPLDRPESGGGRSQPRR